MAKINVFVCYSHADSELILTLQLYLNGPDINVWYDGKIPLGQDWDQDIKNHLDKADVVLLLVSVPFIRSEYIKTVEMVRTLEKKQAKKGTVIPVFVEDFKLKDYKDKPNPVPGSQVSSFDKMLDEIAATQGIPYNADKRKSFNDLKVKLNGIIENGDYVEEPGLAEIPDFDLEGAFNSIYSNLFPGEIIDEGKNLRVLKSYPIVIAGLLREMMADYNTNNGSTHSLLLNDGAFLYTLYNQIVSFLCYIVIKDLRDSNRLQPIDRILFDSWTTESQNRKVKIGIISHSCMNYSDLFIEEFRAGAPFLDSINIMEAYVDENNQVSNLINFRELIFRLIEDLAFLSNYDLLAVRFITVRKSFYDKIAFKHEISRLYGPEPSVYSFKYMDLGEFITVDSFLYNGVILTRRITVLNQLNDIIREKKFLNLWPFIIDGHTNQNDSTGKPQLCIFDNVSDLAGKKQYNYRLVQFKKEREQKQNIEYRSLSSFPGVEEWNNYYLAAQQH